MIKYLPYIILIIGLSACAKKEAKIPVELLTVEEFSDIIVDIRLAESYQKLRRRSGNAPQNLLDSTYHLIYKIHQVEAWEVDSSYKFYATHPKLMSELDQLVLEKLNRLE